MPEKHVPTMEPLDEEVDHVRGSSTGRLTVEYGDYECPYSRQAFRAIERVERRLDGGVRFAFRHFPLTDIHPHALAAATAAEAAALQDRFREMHDLLFHRHKALEEEDLQRYAMQLQLDMERFHHDRAGPRSCAVSVAMSRVVWRRTGCAAHRLCSSTASCTSAATTRQPCWRH